MSDRRTALLYVLQARGALGLPAVQRTLLVKTLYLVETLRPAYRFLSGSFHYVRYHYGPFSFEIEPALSFLLWHGLAKVESYDRRGGRTLATYSVTPHGDRRAAEMRAQGMAATLGALCLDVVSALQGLQVETVKEICDLVYMEPGFRRVLTLHPEDPERASAAPPLPEVSMPTHPARRAQAVMFDVYRRRSHSLAQPSFVARAFLRYLAARAQASAKQR